MAERLDRLPDQIRNGNVLTDTNVLPFFASEAETIADRVEAAIALANPKTLAQASDTQAEDLEVGVAGLFNLSSLRRSIDTNFLLHSTTAQVAHVLVHEGLHYQNKIKSGGERVLDVDVEEALTEAGTTNSLHDKFMAYQTEITDTKHLASSTGNSFEQMVGWYRDGANAKINAVIRDAANDNQGTMNTAA